MDKSLRNYLGLDEWNESEHPRDNVGRFTDTEKSYPIKEILGKEFTGVKGQQAIDLLMKEKQGFVRDAFTRKDIGDIALIWGNDSMGLQHIIKRRKKTNQPLGKLLLSLTEVIEKGELSQDSNGDFVIRNKGKRVVVEPKLYNKKIQFLMTAYYEK